MIVLTTSFPTEKTARETARILVAEKLAACVHILPPHTAIYEWDGKMCEEAETGLLIKTQDHLYGDLEKRILALHPHKVPMIFAVTADQALGDYAAWVDRATKNA